MWTLIRRGDLTTCLGWQETDELSNTISDKLLSVIMDKNENPYDGILRHEEGVDLVPSNLELSSMEMSLVTAMCREMVMKNYLSEIKNSYDYVLIDCMPSLGMITLNALTAADSVIVPVQAQYLPAKGMTQLLTTISNVKRHSNPQLNIDGILLTLVDGRTNLAKSTVDALRGAVRKPYPHLPDNHSHCRKSRRGKLKGQKAFMPMSQTARCLRLMPTLQGRC